MTDLLPEEFVERVALRVVELLRDETVVPSAPEWVDARRVAEEFGVSRDYVYAHASELGAIPLGACGNGRRPRLRFDLATVAEALGARRSSERADMQATPKAPIQRRGRSSATVVELLPIRGRSEAA